MDLPNILKVSNLQKDISESVTIGIEHLKAEHESFIKLLEKKIPVLNSEVSAFVKQVMDLKKTYEILDEEIKKLEDKKPILVALEDKLNKRSSELDKQEESLLALHKTLENKRLILKGKEDELLEKIRRSKVL